jgi:hypothetical protein
MPVSPILGLLLRSTADELDEVTEPSLHVSQATAAQKLPFFSPAVSTQGRDQQENQGSQQA